jgi:hypothetical protein
MDNIISQIDLAKYDKQTQEFIIRQLKYYFKPVNNTVYKYNEAVTDLLNPSNFKEQIAWIEIYKDNISVDIYFIENSNIDNIMSSANNIIYDYNSKIILDQTKLLHKSITKYPYFVIRTGWVHIDSINQPCMLRSSRRHGGTGTIISDNSTQLPELLNNFIDIFKDINYNNKKNDLVWRGVNSGIEYGTLSRNHFIKMFHEIYDVKFIESHILDVRDVKIPSDQVGNTLTQEYMGSNYKFQIALNGNTFSGSFGWNLLSNSVVFSTNEPTKFHTAIYPVEYEDYITIKDDYSDLQDKINYYKNNIDEASNIAKSGRAYMLKFLNLTDTLTELSLDIIHKLYDQDTLVEAINILNSNSTFTKVSFVKSINNYTVI